MTLRPYSDPEPRGRSEYEQAYWGNGLAPHWDDLDDATRAEWAARRVDPAPDSLPKAWAELVEALQIMGRARTGDTRPLHCSHDLLTVCADPGKLTAAERARLDEIGFFATDDPDDGFQSTYYGSA